MAGHDRCCDRVDGRGSGCGVGRADSAALPSRGLRRAGCQRASAMTAALLWLIRWPTRGQSVLFALTGSVCIAASCLVQGDPLAGLLGSGAFAVLGGYIAFFHTAQYMMINFAIAMTTAVVLVDRLVRYYDTVVAGCAFCSSWCSMWRFRLRCNGWSMRWPANCDNQAATR